MPIKPEKLILRSQVNFTTYKRGQIILFDYDPCHSIGYELHGKHFAIVLNKEDSMRNGNLNIIPLTTSMKPYYLDLGSSIFVEIRKKILNRNQKSKNPNIIDSEIKIDFANIKNQLDIQRSTGKLFAMIQNITTISKFRIITDYNPILDGINAELINATLDLIDESIKKTFTK